MPYKNNTEVQKYSGGFVNWAANQGAVAFKYLITNENST